LLNSLFKRESFV